MGKYIFLDAKNRKYLRDTFNVSPGTVSDALNFKTDSDLSRKLCYVALTQLGGKERMDLPIEETIHDYAGFMMQTFENGAVLSVNKKTGYAYIVNKYGDLIKDAYINSLDDLEELQAFAAGR